MFQVHSSDYDRAMILNVKIVHVFFNSNIYDPLMIYPFAI